jgi:hypothetical protein
VPGKEVKNWAQYEALRAQGRSKESAARITNASAKKGKKNMAGKPGKAVARVGHLASRAGQTKKEGMGVVKLARQVARKGAAAKTATGKSAIKTIYREGRTIRKESGRAAEMKFNKSIARIEKNTKRKMTAAKKRPSGSTRRRTS